MNIKTNQVMNLIPVLNKLAGENVSLKLAINIASILQAFEKPNDIIFQRRQQLIDGYAKKDENGEYIFLSEGRIAINNPQEFETQYHEFENTDIEIDVKPLDLEALQNEDIKITAKEYMLLQEVFKNN